MAEYKISLGVQLQTDDIISQINEAERKVDPITIKVDAETKELTKSIQDALKTLSNGSKNALTLDTSKFEGSIAEIKTAVVDLKKVLGSLDDSANMKSLLASVNQIANAIGKVTDESETLAKSLSVLSKKDFGFNFNLKTGNANPIKAATDYGIEARRKAIPAMQEQVAFLQDIIGGTEKADKALERYLVKQNKGFGGVREKERLQREMLGGVDLDGKSVSISRQMGAYEQTISILKKIAIESGKSLDGFDAHFSKAAENIVDDTVKIQTGVKQTEEALEAAANEMKQIFSMGVGAEQLSAQLEPIVSDLNQIREAVQNLSKGVSLDGLTASFDRLSGAIENLLTNAEKVKGVLNSGFDVGVGGDINSIKAPRTTRKTTQNDVNSVIDGYLNELGIGKNDKATVRSKIDAFAKVYSRGAGDELYDAALSDLMHTIKQLGTVSRQADGNMEALLADLKSSKIYAPKEIYKSEFGDDWKHIKSTYKEILRSRTGIPVDSRYQELTGKYPGYFPEDIWNPADQLKQILDVYDTASEMSKNRKVGVYDELGYEGIKDRVLDIVSVMQQQSEAEQKVAQTSTQTADAVSQSQEQIRQEYEKTKQARDEANRQIKEYEQKFKDIEEKNGFVDFGEYQEDFAKWQELENYSDSLTTKMQSLKAQLQGDGISDSFKEVNIAIGNAEDEANSLELALRNIGVSDDNIEKIANQMKEFGVTAKNVKATLGADGDISFKIKGIDDLGRTVTAINSIDIDGNLGEFGRNISQDIDNTAQSFKKLKSLAKEMGDLDIKIAGLEADGKIDEANSLRRVLDGLKSDYQELYLVTEKNLSTDQIKELDQIFANTSGEVREFKQELAEAAKTQELTSGLERLKSIAQEINGLKIELFKAEDTGNIERITNRLNELENESSELRAELQQKFPTASFDQIDDIARKGEEAVAQLVNKVAEAKAKLAQGIKLKISDTGFNGFEQEVLRARNAAEELEGVYPDLEAALKRLDVAMEDVYSADQAGDVKRLVAANEEYEASLKQVYSQLKLYQQAEKKAYDADILQQKKATLSSEMKSWLKENTRAAKDFGEEIRRLDASLDGLDGKGVKLVGQQFKSITKQAQAMGKTGLTTFDRLKSKAKEYMSYLSAAEMFMYAEQAFRSMFEQVQLIDTAMTELKKVTDETDASYNKFLSNAASRSKELGTTIDGLVSSTADFARLGYGFEDAQGLAEVANVYAVVGDEIEGVEGATESLISTMAAFKAEANGLSESDFALNIVDKFNEVSNNYAISSGGLGEALKRSASALFSANNTLDESIAMITASNTVVQDASVVGNAYKTIALRIRGAKSELEEMGEDTSDMAESSSKLREELLALSGVDILEADGQTFKSTYDILDEISKVYHDLSDLSQANILEKLAGKRQSNILSAALENFDIARNALETSMGSSGSAMREHAKWSESLEADSCLVA